MKTKHFYVIASVVVILDQASKHFALNYLASGAALTVVPGLAYLTATRNPGGAFGILQSWAGLLTLITLAVVATILTVSHRKSGLSAPIRFSLALLLGGSVGNLIDRLRFDCVIDFVKIGAWPVFNLADCAITAGVILLSYQLIFRETRTPPRQGRAASRGSTED